MSLDKDKIKESLTDEEIKLILHSLGSKDPIEGNQYQTVCHGGEKHKLYYYEESKMFHCYTSCSENMDIYEVVIRSHSEKGITLTFYQAIQYVANKTGKHYRTDNSKGNQVNHLVDDWNWMNRLKKKEKINPDIPVVSENILDVLINLPHEIWLKEISYETLMKFEVGYYCRENRIVTPHRNIHNDLIGLTGRALNQEDIDNGKKYMPITIENKLYSFPTIFNLYGLNKTQYAIKRLKKAAIFESQKSVMKCEDFYGNDNFSVATCSSNISNYHRDILLSLGVEEVFICSDKFRGRKENETEEIYAEKLIDYQEHLLKLAKKFSPFVRVYILWDFNELLEDKESPSDRGKFTLEKLMKEKFEVSTKDEVIA